jgi:hypothetical protein
MFTLLCQKAYYLLIKGTEKKTSAPDCIEEGEALQTLELCTF